MIVSKRLRDRYAILWMIALLPLQACSDPSEPPVAATVAVSGPLPPTATVGTPVTPSVLVADASGRPIRGAAVTFQAMGGGSVANSSATTNGEGIATPGPWTMSTAAGNNTLRATAGSVSTTLTVEAVASVPVEVTPVESNPTTAVINALIPTPPSVRVVDTHGNPVRNVQVVFTPQAGSGVVTGGTVVTNTNGTARPGTWTLGPSAGPQRLNVSAAGHTTTITVTALSPPFAKFAGDQTACPVNTTQCFFTVIASTETGAPVVGQPVTWTTPGGATLTTTTNSRGRSTVPNLTASATPGPSTQTARFDATGDEVTFNFQVVAGGGFDIVIQFIGEVPSTMQTAAAEAAARWEQVITGDLNALTLNAPANQCGVTHPAFNGQIDDLVIFMMADSIDGVGSTLGRAGPCYIRNSNSLPVFGVMQLDRDDVASMAANGTLTEVVLHEMGHVLGFGTMWGELGLISGAGGADPFFTGVRARSGFQLVGGELLNGVPIENTGGSGTRDGHWREATFSRELMTGFVSNPPNPLSAMTIASFMDMGYQVNFGAADNYLVAGGVAGLRAADAVLQPRPHTEPLPLDRPLRVPVR